MFHLAFYQEGDKLINMLEIKKLSKVVEEAKKNTSGIDKFEIFADEWKSHHLVGKVTNSGSIDWVRINE